MGCLPAAAADPAGDLLPWCPHQGILRLSNAQSLRAKSNMQMKLHSRMAKPTLTGTAQSQTVHQLSFLLGL